MLCSDDYGIEHSAHRNWITSELNVYFPVSFLLASSFKNWSVLGTQTSIASVDGGNLGWRWTLSQMFLESHFNKMQMHPPNHSINLGECLGAKKFGFVTEVVTEQQRKCLSLKNFLASSWHKKFPGQGSGSFNPLNRASDHTHASAATWVTAVGYLTTAPQREVLSHLIFITAVLGRQNSCGIVRFDCDIVVIMGRV